MLATQAAIEALAEQIERAYRLRRPGWYRGCSSARVWETAATTLLQLHEDDPALPLDPVLFVAVQPVDTTTFADPWVELVQPAAAQRYRKSIRDMVRGLRTELRGEVRWAEGRIDDGDSITKVLMKRSQRLSPLGSYIVARRAGCIELAKLFEAPAAAQHHSCPLYRTASRTLLPPGHYPVQERSFDEETVAMTRHTIPQTLLN